MREPSIRDEYKEPQSLKNQFVVKQKNNRIMEENIELFKKIVQSNSEIGLGI